MLVQNDNMKMNNIFVKFYLFSLHYDFSFIEIMSILLFSLSLQVPWKGTGSEKYYFENDNVSNFMILGH